MARRERPDPVSPPVPDSFAFPFLGLTGGLIALATAVMAPLVPLGMAPALITLSVLSGGLLLWRRRRLPALPPSLVLPLLLFWLLGAVSIAWTPVPVSGLAQAITFLYEAVPALLLLGFLLDLPPALARSLTRIAVWGLGIGLALFAVETLADQPLYRLAKLLEGTLVAEERALNRPSVILALLLWPVAFILAARGKAAALALPAGYFLLTLATPSASAVVGSAAGLLTLLAAWRWPLTTARLWMGVTILGFAASVPFGLWLAAVDPEILNRLPFSFAHRVGIWHFVAQRAAEHPWLGWGLDASRAIPEGGQILAGLALDRQSLPLHPHNIFLQTRLELGWIGAGLLAWFGVALLRWAARLDPGLRPFVLACYASALTIACFAYGAWQTWWICAQLFTALLFTVAARRAGSDKPLPRP